MIKLIQNRLFRERVLKNLEAQSVALLDKAVGTECFATFVTIALESDIPKNFCDVMRSRKLSVHDASIAYLDASISAVKKVGSDDEKDRDIARIVANMEIWLDAMFLNEPGLVIPRNGFAGPKFASFT